MHSKALTLGSLFDGLGGWQIAAVRANVTPLWSSEIEKFPLALTKVRFPDTKQLGDITKIDGSQIEPVDILTMGSPCFVAGTKVYTVDGFRGIETLKIGDLVLSHNGEFHTVTDTMEHVDSVGTVKIMGAMPITCTDNHPFYCREVKRVRQGSKYKRVLGEPIWVKAKDLTPNHYIKYVIPSGTTSEITEEEAWLMGRYTADGYINNTQRSGRPVGQKNHKTIFCVGKRKIDEFRKHLDQYHACIKNDRTVYKAEIVDVRLMGLCSLCGRGALNKIVPDIIINAPKNIGEAFLDGYLSGDGYYVQSTNGWSATTVSENLTLSIQMLVAKLYKTRCKAYRVEVSPTTVIEGRTVNQHTQYGIRFFKDHRRQDHCMIDETGMWIPVKEGFKESNYQTVVYNIEVDGTHTYNVQGLAVHNCQNLSVSGNRKGLAGNESCLFREGIRIAREMRKATNGAYPRYLVWENVPGAFSTNKGADFRAVLEEITEAEIPMPRSGKWATAGLVRSPKCTVGWRTLDAQYWGVAQRRRRIFLVADYRDGGGAALRKYFLSPKACQGILRRAKTKGKVLPDILTKALESQAATLGV